MWREESGVLEMFLAYYSQFEENVSEKKAYRDFLLEVLCLHERSIKDSVPAVEVEPDMKTEVEAAASESDFAWSFGLRSEAANLPLPPSGCFEEALEMMEDKEELPPFAHPVAAIKLESDVQILEDQSFDPAQKPCLSASASASAFFSASASASASALQDSSVGLGDLLSPDRPLPTSPRFSCKVCGGHFVSASALCKHRRVHVGKSEVCQVCGKAFHHSWSLRKHERIHTGEKPFACKFCGRSFSEAANLRKHERIHTGERYYVCKVCSRSFIHASSLRVHRCRGPLGEALVQKQSDAFSL